MDIDFFDILYGYILHLSKWSKIEPINDKCINRQTKSRIRPINTEKKLMLPEVKRWEEGQNG